jgi:hypothetical protein
VIREATSAYSPAGYKEITPHGCAKDGPARGYTRPEPQEEDVSLQLPQKDPMELNLNSVNQLIFVMVKCGVLFEVRTEFLNNI